jgi:hypothetical protein
VFFRRWLEPLRPWPQSLFQSIENPLQPDRLEDTSGIELEYPAYKHTPAENRRHTRNLLVLGLLLVLVLYLGEVVFQSWWIGTYFHATFATVAMVLFLVAYLGRRRPWWRWPVFVLVCPVVSAAFYVLRESHLMLGVAMFFGVLLADLFATHFFQLKTTVPMPRDRALQLRALWSARFRPSLRAATGLELYWASLLTIPCVFLVLLYLAPSIATGGIHANVPRALLGLLLLLAFPCFLEALAAFLCARPLIRPRVMFRGFWAALVDWFTYNRQGARGPGTFRSPAGSYRQRRRMGLSLIVLFGTCFVQWFSLHRDVTAEFDAMDPELRNMERRSVKDKILDATWPFDESHGPPTPTPPPTENRGPAFCRPGGQSWLPFLTLFQVSVSRVCCRGASCWPASQVPPPLTRTLSFSHGKRPC